jgi:hypothetical protein
MQSQRVPHPLRVDLRGDTQGVLRKYQYDHLRFKVGLAVYPVVCLWLLFICSTFVFEKNFLVIVISILYALSSMFVNFFLLDYFKHFFPENLQSKMIDAVRELITDDNPKSVDVLLEAILVLPSHSHSNSERSIKTADFIPKATEWLYLLSQDDLSQWTFEQNQCLYTLLREPQWIRKHPDLVAAAMTALFNGKHEIGRKVIETVAGCKRKRRDEQWVQDAAKACLVQWESVSRLR